MRITIEMFAYFIVLWICTSKLACGSTNATISFSAWYSGEARKILYLEGIKSPTSNEKKLAKIMAYTDEKNRNLLKQEQRELGELKETIHQLRKTVLPTSCRRLFRDYMKKFGRGFMVKIGCASDLYPGVQQVFKQIEAFVKKRFDVIRINVFALLHLYLVGSTNETHVAWSNQVKSIYHGFKKINICNSTQSEPENKTILNDLILGIKAAANESDAVEKFKQQCLLHSWSNVILNDAKFTKLAIQAPTHEKIEFIRKLVFFNLTKAEVDYVTDLFIAGTYFESHKFEEFPKLYEQCATVFYFSRSCKQRYLKKNLTKMFGKNLPFGNMVDQFCFEFANLYEKISYEDVEELSDIQYFCKPNSTEMYEFIKEIGDTYKSDNYRSIAAVVGVIGD